MSSSVKELKKRFETSNSQAVAGEGSSSPSSSQKLSAVRESSPLPPRHSKPSPSIAMAHVDERERSLSPPPRPVKSPFITLKKATATATNANKDFYSSTAAMVNITSWTDPSTEMVHKVMRLNRDEWRSCRQVSETNAASVHSSVGFFGSNERSKLSIINMLLQHIKQDSTQYISDTNASIDASGMWYFCTSYDDNRSLSLCNFHEASDLFHTDADPTVDGHHTNRISWKRQFEVKYDMRRLAYASSQVVIYVMEKDTLDQEALDEIGDFAVSLFKDVENVDCPSLLIINNVDIHTLKSKQTKGNREFDDHFDISKSTTRLLSQNDDLASTLLAYFSDVQLINLPNVENKASQSHDHGANNNLLSKQISAIWNLLREWLEEKCSTRVDSASHTNERTWLNLMYLLVRDFYQFDEDGSELECNVVDMGSLLLHVMTRGQTSLQIATDYFAELRRRMKKTLVLVSGMIGTFPHQKLSLTPRKFSDKDMKSIYNFMETPNSANIALLSACISTPAEFDTKNFITALKSAGLVLISTVIREVLSFATQDIIDTNIAFSVVKQNEIWSTQLLPALDRFYDLSMEQMPCGSLLNCNSLCSPIACDQTKKYHHKEWHHCEYRFSLAEDNSLPSQLANKFRMRWGGYNRLESQQRQITNMPAQWIGGYCAAEGKGPPTKDIFIQYVKKYYEKLTTCLRKDNNLLKAKKIITAFQLTVAKYSFESGQLPGLLVKNYNRCMCCGGDYISSEMEGSANLKAGGLQPKSRKHLTCGHEMCEECLDVVLFPEDFGSTIADELTIEKVTFASCSKLCPFCCVVANPKL